MMRLRFAVRITHEPTGEAVSVDSDHSRSMIEAHKKAMRILRSRIFAAKNGAPRSDEEVAVYDLPDDVEYPNDLGEYRLDK